LPGKMHEQRNVQDGTQVLQAAMSEKSALKALAMIRGDNHGRVLPAPCPTELLHETTELAVRLCEPLVVTQAPLVDLRLFAEAVVVARAPYHIVEFDVCAQLIRRQEAAQIGCFGQVRVMRGEYVHPQKERIPQLAQYGGPLLEAPARRS